MQQQITEICRVQLFQTRLILSVDLYATVIIGPRIGSRHLRGRQCTVLPAIDDPCQHTRGPPLVINAFGGNQLL